MVPAAAAAGVGKAAAWLGQAALRALLGFAKRKAARLAFKNLKLILAVVLTGGTLSAAVPSGLILLVTMTMGAGFNAGLPPAPPPGPQLPPGQLVCPVPGAVMTQPFGPTDLELEPQGFGYPHFHTGVDLAKSQGSPVIAAESGHIELATTQTDGVGYPTGYGRYIRIVAGQGRQDFYAHLLQWAVLQGDNVRQSQLIGWVGSTGNSTGPHTHFEVRVQGTPVDPAPAMRPC